MDRSSFTRKGIPFPTAVIREAIINAIIHRDYGNKRKSRTGNNPEKIEVRSLRTNFSKHAEGLTKLHCYFTEPVTLNWLTYLT